MSISIPSQRYSSFSPSTMWLMPPLFSSPCLQKMIQSISSTSISMTHLLASDQPCFGKRETALNTNSNESALKGLKFYNDMLSSSSAILKQVLKVHLQLQAHKAWPGLRHVGPLTSCAPSRDCI